MRYEPTSVRAAQGPRRAGRPPSGPPLPRRLYPAPLQILLASDQGQRPSQIAATLGCSSQAVRNALHAFAADGLGCLQPKPRTPHTIHAAWPKDRDEDLRTLLHQSPRACGKPTSLWALDLAAQVCYEKGWTPRRKSGAAIRLALKRLGVGWKRARHWLVSPDPEYARKKKCATG